MSDKPEIVADWWYCGDICACQYPRVWRKEPGPYGGPDLDKGPWSCDGEQTEEQWEWLLEAARRHGADNLSEIEDEAKAHLDLT